MRHQTSLGKRIIALLLVVVLLVSSVGCGKRANTDLESGADKTPVDSSVPDKLPVDNDRDDLELIVDLLGGGQSTDELSDKELGELVDDLVNNIDNQKPTVQLPTAPEDDSEPEVELEMDGSAYDENGAMTRPFDQVYPELIESGAVKFSDEALLIKMKSGKLTDGLKAAGVAALEKIVPLEGSAWYTASLTAGTDVKKALADVRALKEVLLAEYDYQVKSAAVEETAVLKQWHLDGYGIPEAQTVMTSNGGDASVVVAVIDTGVDIDHEDLKDNIWCNTKETPGNGIDDDDNGYIDDYYGVNIVDYYGGNGDDDNGHGTHVAGIIAAQENNLGVKGIAHNVQIMAVKAGNHSGFFMDSDIARAVLYAYTNGAEVINMSFGGTSCSLAVQDALATAYSRCVLVASAGNDGSPNEFANMSCQTMPNYPAALSYVLGVMSVDGGGKVSVFSNWDVIAYNGVEYEVAAPGEAIVSTLPNDQYGALSGTSMAAPVVSAMAAILRSEFTDRDQYPTKFIYGQLASTSEEYAQCNDPLGHQMTGDSHALPQIVDLYDALTTLPKPEVQLNDYLYFDSVELSEKNNGDGVIDAGETIALGLILSNRWGASENTQVTIDTLSMGGMSDPYITIANPTVNYGGVGTFSMGDCGRVETDGVMTGWKKPFLITVADNCPNDYLFTINVTITCENKLDEADTATYTTKGSLTEAVRSGKILPSVIDEDMVLTADNLYIIPNSTTIKQGVTVRVEPGTHIQFWSNEAGDPYANEKIAYLVVNGKFLVEGTKDNPVHMYPSQLMDHYNVDIGATSTGYVSLKYANITNGYEENSGGKINYAEGCIFTVNYLHGQRIRTLYSSSVGDQSSTSFSTLSLQEAKDCVFYKIGANGSSSYSSGGKYSYWLGGKNYTRCLFVDCALTYEYSNSSGGKLVLKDCVFLGNSLVDRTAPKLVQMNGEAYIKDTPTADYVEAQNGYWRAAEVYYCADTGTTYIASYSGNYSNSELSFNHILPDYIRQLGGEYAVLETEEEMAWVKTNVIDKRSSGNVYHMGISYNAEKDKHTWWDGTEVGDFVDTTGLTETANPSALLVYCGEDNNYNVVNALVETPTKSTSQGYVLYEIPGEVLPTEITFHAYEMVLDTADGSVYQIAPQSKPVTLPLESYRYESSDENVLTVSATGLVTPVGLGKADVTVFSRDGAVWNYISFEVKEPVSLESIAFGSDSTELAVGEKANVKVTFTPADTTRRYVTFESSDTGVVNIDRGGTMTAISSGTATITATCDGQIATMEVTAYVEAGSLKLDTTGFAAAIGDGTAALPKVTTSKGSEPTIVWRSSDEEIAVVENGAITLKAEGVTTLTATDLRSGLSDSCLLIVQQAAVDAVKEVTANYANYEFAMYYAALTESGKVYAWTGIKDSLEKIADDATAVAVDGRGSNAMLLYAKTDGTLVRSDWDSEKGWENDAPVEFEALKGKTITGLKVFYYDSTYAYFATTADGLTYAWGDAARNSYGQLGVGTIDAVAEPMLINLANVADIQSYYYSNWFLTTDGKLYQAGMTPTGNSAVPVLRAEGIVSMELADGRIYALTKDQQIMKLDYSSSNITTVDISAFAPVFASFTDTDTGVLLREDGSACYLYDGTVYELETLKNAVSLYRGYGAWYITTEEGLLYGVGGNFNNAFFGTTGETRVFVPVLLPLMGLPADQLSMTGTNLQEIKEEVDGAEQIRYVLNGENGDALVIRFNKELISAAPTLYANGSKVPLNSRIINETDLEITLTGGFIEKNLLGEGVAYRLVLEAGSVIGAMGLSNTEDTVIEFTYTAAEEATEEEVVIHESSMDMGVERILTGDKVVELICEYEQTHQYNPKFSGNAVLNRFATDTDVKHWMRPTAPSVSLGAYDEIPLGGNYWGTTSQTAIELQMLDYTDYQSYARLVYEPYLTEAPENTFPFATSVTLLNKNGETVTKVGNEEVTFCVTFNRDMDTTIPLRVSFGSAYPYADYLVEGEYVDERTWKGTYTLNTLIENGQQYIAISNGCSAEDDLDLYADEARFGFTIDTTAAQALIMQGTATDTGIQLRWTQDDFKTLMGYNVYRSTALNGYYQRLNDTVIPAKTMEFFDDTVEPGQVYYYNFTVVQTDLSESTPSGKIVIMSKDTMAPNMYHSPVYTATMGQNLIVSAEVTDNLSVSYVNLYYRTVGAAAWKTIRMNSLNDKYSAIIPAADLSVDGLEYYLEAFDGISSTYRGTDEEPYQVSVRQALDKNSLGDVNGDGFVSNLDALILLQAISHKYNMTEEEFARADLNQDGELHAVEALRILHYVSGQVGSLDMTTEELR